MFIIQILRWLLGYIVFSTSADSAGRLMNICARKNLLIWDNWQDNTVFQACVNEKAYKRLCRLSSASGIELREVGRRGMKELLWRYRKRFGILVGIVLFLAVLIISQQFIWQVEIEGCRTLDQEQLIQVLDDLGIHRGTLKKEIDLRFTAREVQIRADGISWVALNIHGTTAILRIKERIMPPQKIDSKVPANVVALEDGQIVRLSVTDGKSVLKEGHTVRKNEIIVSGIWQDRWGMTHLVRANGSVFAHVPRTLEAKIPLKQEERISIGKIEQRNYFSIFGLKVPLFLYSPIEGDYKLEQFSYTPTLFGADMPFLISRENYIFYSLQEAVLTEEQALRIAEKKIVNLERQNFGGNKVVSSQTQTHVEDGYLTLRGEYEVEMDIAVQKEIPIFDRTLQDAKPLREGGY